MHSGNLVNALGRIMHLPSARALSRTSSTITFVTRLPPCTKTRKLIFKYYLVLEPDPSHGEEGVWERAHIRVVPTECKHP